MKYHELCSWVSTFTGGLPLFVKNSVVLTKDFYNQDAGLLCRYLESQQQIAPTVQEAILSRVIDNISKISKNTFIILSLSDIPITLDETSSLLIKSLGINTTQATESIRELVKIGVIQQLKNGSLVIHDAFRLLAIQNQHELPEETLKNALINLRDMLKEYIEKTHDPGRLSLYIRLLPLTGGIKTLIDIAGSEFFVEFGFAKEMRSVIEIAIKKGDLSVDDLFWALDALSFWDLQENYLPLIEPRLQQMEKLLPTINNNTRAHQTLLLKKLELAGKKNNLTRLRQLFYEALKYQEDKEYWRIMRYSYARMLFDLERYSETETKVWALINDYYQFFDLSVEDIVGKNHSEIREKLPAGVGSEELKHLADCLDLYAQARNAQNKKSGLARLHAVRFYEMSGAVSSLVRVGQDAVDELLNLIRDAQGARQFMESDLLPNIQRYRLFDYLIQVRSQYAVVLAYCGDIEKANKEITQLEAFVDTLQGDRLLEFKTQKHMIAEIARGNIKLGYRSQRSGGSPVLGYRNG